MIICRKSLARPRQIKKRGGCMSRNSRYKQKKREEERNAIKESLKEKEEELLEKLRHYVELGKKAVGKDSYVFYDQMIKKILECLRDIKWASNTDSQYFSSANIKIAMDEFKISVLEEVCKAMEEQAAGLYESELDGAELYLKYINGEINIEEFFKLKAR
ncbi:hypothetical protein G7K71_08055 [Desulfofundulus sp. TPOSR]|uniref:hypothetical protein n=1 Tax=Desulfofundulus sp. TPOSR TaxID=2714340 RepID=UPI00140D495E|nr:hypothetical protein [Desulfofundulus sp. TPOSR]NHM26935.1 hypothetical protein [Desulfofundulus sp. TPOSR]